MGQLVSNWELQLAGTSPRLVSNWELQLAGTSPRLVPKQGLTHPSALLLGVQQREVVGGRQAWGGEDISQGHSGFSQKPGGEEQRGVSGEGAEEPWCKPGHQ